MKTCRRAERKRERTGGSSLAEREGEVVGRRVVVIRDNQFVKPPARMRKAAG
jgi:hypothetical protein